MKRLVALLFTSVMSLSLVACSSLKSNNNTLAESTDSEVTDAVEEVVEEQTPETITIKSLDGNQTVIELEVPYNPERIAILDMAALDILDNLNVGDRVVGSAGVSLDYLSEYADNSEIVNLGTIKEVDLESVMACEPDVIFIGDRLASYYDALSEIAPVVYLSTDIELGVVESVRQNATAIASMFGLEEKVTAKTADYATRIEALKETVEGKSALVGMTTSGSFNLLGNDGRCSIIGVELGFENLAANDSSSTHGNESSFELVLQMNPEYIFVMDRDRAIGADGVQFAQEIMENELVMQTDAYQNGKIVYLENPIVWYTAEGGITALDIMLSDIEAALLAE